MARIRILCLLLAGLTAGPALAGIGEIYVEYVTPANEQDASLTALPDGSGPALTDARSIGGIAIDASITIRLVDPQGVPIANYPWEDIWIAPDSGELANCRFYFASINMDGNTDADGIGRFSGPAFAGGAAAGPFHVYISGDIARIFVSGGQHPPLPLRINSADLNGDLRVGLADVPLFAADFFLAYAYRSDFNWDGAVNLSDMVWLASALGNACP